MTKAPAAPVGQHIDRAPWAMVTIIVALSAVSIVESAPAILRLVVWLAAIGIAGTLYFRSENQVPQPRSFSWAWLVALVLVATLLRTLWLSSIPQGAYIDEVFTLRNTLAQLERPFDLFGMTPLIKEGWVVTSNLYLGFNTLILRIFGVSYFTIKMFSVIPGVAACAFFYLACTRLFPARVAVVVALLFVWSHWHLRLSRYGWDASFLVMTLAAATWLLLRSANGRPFSAYLAGIAAAIGLYSYINGRLCVVALGAYVLIRAVRSRERDDLVRLGAFSSGVLITAAPLLAYFAGHMDTTWVRTAELSIFHLDHPLITLLDNIWRHALMFNVRGGSYARDNFPAIPMLDSLTGLLFLGGLVLLVVRRKEQPGGLFTLVLLGTMLGGILSISQEGAPYIYRVSAAIVPTILIAGVGFNGVVRQFIKSFPRVRAARIELLAGAATMLVIAPSNASSYFRLEAQSNSAERVMGNKYRLMGETIRRTKGPFYLVLPSALAQRPILTAANETNPAVNGSVYYEYFGVDVLALSLIAFSGEYDLSRSRQENFRTTRIGLIDQADLQGELHLPIALLFDSDDSLRTATLREHYHGRHLHEELIRNDMGTPVFRLVTIAP